MPARNPLLTKGVRQFGRAKAYGRKRQDKFAKKEGKPAAAKSTRADPLAGRFIAGEDAPYPLAGKVGKAAGSAKLKSSIEAGSVLIVLSGRFKGCRVVFLKQLESGLLLVTGPYKSNGVPIRRINQAYVIGTSTKVDISGVKVPEHINDAYFSRVSQPKDGEDGFFNNQEKINPEWLAQRQKDQQALDTQVLAAVEKTPQLAQYLAAKFTLSKGQAPHNMKF